VASLFEVILRDSDIVFSFHWYLVIIMFPENLLRSAKPIYQEIEPDISSHGDLIKRDITEALPMEVVEETPESSHPSSNVVSPQQMHVDGYIKINGSLIPGTITVPGSSEKAHRTSASSRGLPEEGPLNILGEELSLPSEDSWKVYQDKWVGTFSDLCAF